MLDDQLKAQLAAYLERVQQPFELVASLDDSETSAQMHDLLKTIQSLRSDKISLRTDGSDARKPSFTLQRQGTATQLRFAGLPWAMNSPRWCWPCCGRAAILPRWSRT
jgi:alkyl hydroperoxide reductase subunit F